MAPMFGGQELAEQALRSSRSKDRGRDVSADLMAYPTLTRPPMAWRAGQIRALHSRESVTTASRKKTP
jgi:hypothetical protein